MRLRKWSIGVYVALGLALCLTGCGQSEQKETKNQPSDSIGSYGFEKRGENVERSL